MVTATVPRGMNTCSFDPLSVEIFSSLPNYGDRYRHGEKISTAFAESAVNQVISKRMVKKQQMQWTESGAHNLLQIRTKVLNNQLRKTFVRWYPGMQNEQELEIQKKAA
jgi:hypothetical protein